MSAHTIAAALFAASVVGGTGCASDSVTSPSVGPAAVYSLPQIDGTVFPGQVVRGALFIPDDNRYCSDFIATLFGLRKELDASGSTICRK